MLRWAVAEAIRRQPAGTARGRSRTPSSTAAARRPAPSPRSPPPGGGSPWSAPGCATGTSAVLCSAGRPHDLSGPAAERQAAVHSAPAPRRARAPPCLTPPGPARTRPMPRRGHPGGKRSDERSQQAARPQAGHGAPTTASTQTPTSRGPFPAGHDHRLAGARVKDASAAACGGRAPPGPFDPASPLPRTRHLRGEKGEPPSQFSMPGKHPAAAKPQAETPLDAGPLLQG
jgi:hypothetical protein